MAYIPPEEARPTATDGVGVVRIAFRFLWLCAVLLLGTAIVLGTQSQSSQSQSQSQSSQPTAQESTPEHAAAHVGVHGSTTRVGLHLPDGEYASHILVTSPDGEDLFEITYYRNRQADVRYARDGERQAAISVRPDGEVGFCMRRANAAPRIGPRTDDGFVEILWHERRPGMPVGQVWMESQPAADARMGP